ncbi:helix-turn-helix transcriptional regulator [Gemmatimonas sp.]|jgi:DNA-binding CsgD family transcriptional regulator|uniref:helix-turn-helix transcriptional regulator n=2 Tax=Gemmatimonas sp. TaxID=1962908 RepID=UPI0025B8CD7C|nr:LuxR C-terminal-related transcriptional regulator [Gemmatimonas sp.]MCA2984164.1 helix-turn-helix domain-containing protein [Gemmatimonas sp.]
MDHDIITVESDTLTGAWPPVLIGFLLLIVVGGLTDIALDRPQSWFTAHIAVEVGMVAVSLSFAVLIFSRWRRSQQALNAAQASLAATARELAERQAERDVWRANAEQALAGFGLAIDRQFTTWQFTRAEREVALLLLKGLGHKQVAASLGRSERTVRQQAVEAYRKAGVQGRSELAAFFLADLALPGAGEQSGGQPGLTAS